MNNTEQQRQEQKSLPRRVYAKVCDIRLEPMYWKLPISIFVFIVIVIFGIIFFTADDALPGDLLFPVDRFTEELSYILAFDEIDKVEVRVTQLEERVHEFEYIRQQSIRFQEEIGNPELAVQQLQQALQNAEAEIRIAVEQYEESDFPDRLRSLQSSFQDIHDEYQDAQYQMN